MPLGTSPVSPAAHTLWDTSGSRRAPGRHSDAPAAGARPSARSVGKPVMPIATIVCPRNVPRRQLPALVVSAVLAATAAIVGQSTVPPQPLSYAELVLHNGQVLTVDQQFTVTQAVATRDGKVLAVGTDAEIRALAGPKTRIVDLAGRTVDTGLHLQRRRQFGTRRRHLQGHASGRRSDGPHQGCPDGGAAARDPQGAGEGQAWGADLRQHAEGIATEGRGVDRGRSRCHRPDEPTRPVLQ